MTFSGHRLPTNVTCIHLSGSWNFPSCMPISFVSPCSSQWWWRILVMIRHSKRINQARRTWRRGNSHRMKRNNSSGGLMSYQKDQQKRQQPSVRRPGCKGRVHRAERTERRKSSYQRRRIESREVHSIRRTDSVGSVVVRRSGCRWFASDSRSYSPSCIFWFSDEVGIDWSGDQG